MAGGQFAYQDPEQANAYGPAVPKNPTDQGWNDALTIMGGRGNAVREMGIEDERRNYAPRTPEN
jgi:hypothetical protein